MLFAFSGLKGSGKDTAANVLVTEYGFTRIAFADAVRELALIVDPLILLEDDWQPSHLMRLSQVVSEYGWDWAKRAVPEVRRLLQVIGTEGGRMLVGENVWVDILTKRFPDIADESARYVITDCRFDNEVDFVRNNGGKLVWINRPGLVSDGHASESEHIRDLASVVVYNTQSIEVFENTIRQIVEFQLGGVSIGRLTS
jgi:hypothetical protein